VNTSGHDPMLPSGAEPSSPQRIVDAAVKMLLAGIDNIRTTVEQEHTRARARYRLNGRAYDEGWMDATAAIADEIDSFRESFKRAAAKVDAQ
jgi:hypothetical protein